MRKIVLIFLGFPLVSLAGTADPTSASAPAISSGSPATGVTQSQNPSPSANASNGMVSSSTSGPSSRSVANSTPPSSNVQTGVAVPSSSQAGSPSSSSQTGVSPSQATPTPPASSPSSSGSPSSDSPLAPQTAAGSSSSVDGFLTVRDPFKKPETLVAKLAPRSELERFPADAYKYVGLLTGPTRLRAMIIDPNGKAHFVTEKAKLGQRGGVISAITSDSIRVREKQVNLLGQEESFYIDIKMPSTSKQIEVQKTDSSSRGSGGQDLGGAPSSDGQNSQGAVGGAGPVPVSLGNTASSASGLQGAAQATDTQSIQKP